MGDKIREAATSGERLSEILIKVVNKNEARNALARKQGRPERYVLRSSDFLTIVQPFLDLSETQAELAHDRAGKVISTALREKALMEVTSRQSSALFAIAEILRKLETPGLYEFGELFLHDDKAEASGA